MTIAGVSNLLFKFDVTLDILEEDNKGFSSAARDKNCFKLRQDLRKQVSITVQQLTNKHLIVERFVLFVEPIVTHTTLSDFHPYYHLWHHNTSHLQTIPSLFQAFGSWGPPKGMWAEKINNSEGVRVGGESEGMPVVLFNKSSSQYTRMVYPMIGLFWQLLSTLRGS